MTYTRVCVIQVAHSGGYFRQVGVRPRQIQFIGFCAESCSNFTSSPLKMCLQIIIGVVMVTVDALKSEFKFLRRCEPNELATSFALLEANGCANDEVYILYIVNNCYECCF